MNIETNKTLVMPTATARRIDLVANREDTLPRQVMVDEIIHLHLSGFAPGQLVTIEAVYTPAEGVWKAQATFLTDDRGGVDIATQAPLSGTYDHVDAMGLFWSMELDARAASPRDNRIELRAVQGEHVAAVTIERLFMAAGVVRRVVREQGLFGTLFTPPGEGPHPGLLVLGGSVGGLSEVQAQMFASHGYAALALAYFRYETLPAELLSIPLEYFDIALKWMRSQNRIRGDQIGVYGVSKGGELALLLGATFPHIKAVVGVVPSGVVWKGLSSVETGGFGVGNGAKAGSQSSWSLHGQDLPFVPFKLSPEFIQSMQAALQARTPIALTPIHLHSLTSTDAETLDRAAIRVERTQGPILLVSGEDDQLWPSSMLSDMAVTRLAQHQYAYPYRHLKYPGAGHLIAIPCQPTTTNSGGVTAFKMAFGGNAKSQAAAARDAWTQILRFLAQYLPICGGRSRPQIAVA